MHRLFILFLFAVLGVQYSFPLSVQDVERERIIKRDSILELITGAECPERLSVFLIWEQRLTVKPIASLHLTRL